MGMDPILIRLDNLGDGAAEELFQQALKQALANLQDPNTDWKAKREITLKFTLATDESRREGAIQVACKTKLAGVKPHQSLILIGHHHGELAAVEAAHNRDLFTEPGAKPSLAGRAAAQ